MSDGIIELRSLNCNFREMRKLVNKTKSFNKIQCFEHSEQFGISYLSHDSDGSFSGGLCHSVFHQVEHVFIVQQTDQVERAETGCTAQS